MSRSAASAEEGNPVRVRCHTGKAFSTESLVAAAGEGIAEALWNAIRALEDGRLLMLHLAVQLENGDRDRAAALEAQAREVRVESVRVRQVATARVALTTAEVP
jgi:two-component system chemotaxis response regulator CheB